MSTIEMFHCTLVHHSKETSILSLYVDNFFEKKKKKKSIKYIGWMRQVIERQTKSPAVKCFTIEKMLAFMFSFT